MRLAAGPHFGSRNPILTGIRGYNLDPPELQPGLGRKSPSSTRSCIDRSIHKGPRLQASLSFPSWGKVPVLFAGNLVISWMLGHSTSSLRFDSGQGD